MNQFVQCLIDGCGRGDLKRITPTHLKQHGWTMQMYRTKFPTAPIASEVSIQLMVATMVIVNLKPAVKEKRRISALRCNGSPEARRRESLRNRGENHFYFGKKRPD